MGSGLKLQGVFGNPYVEVWRNKMENDMEAGLVVKGFMAGTSKILVTKERGARLGLEGAAFRVLGLRFRGVVWTI